MNLHQRIEILVKLGEYLLSDDAAWQETKTKAGIQNGWFVPQFVDAATAGITHGFLQPDALKAFAHQYLPQGITYAPQRLGIVMAGNIPMVGFHDMMCGILAGHQLVLKPSSKDEILMKHLVATLQQWAPDFCHEIIFAEQLKGCDAYIATGSNNSSRYFDYYFRNYPSIIRRNRTSVAVLDGSEDAATLERLADDMLLYFGLGCRNVSKLYVPRNYDFVPLLRALDKYSWMADHFKFKNNYDYNLSLLLLNNKFYMTNGTVLLTENEGLFSPISQVHYSFYDSIDEAALLQEQADNLQCLCSKQHIPFGQAQQPGLSDFADGVDTMLFLTTLPQQQ